jgi:hypothetical protein
VLKRGWQDMIGPNCSPRWRSIWRRSCPHSPRHAGKGYEYGGRTIHLRKSEEAAGWQRTQHAADAFYIFKDQ